jgi:2-C-methyl-D-erythritol 4-phosphate cytidylyltransferase/2-C-methyl-D-erythritol 2,4-cyclodiphosphate synthase
MSKTHNPAFTVLIAAAGSGTRAGGPVPKQYAPLAGKTVLRHTIEKFLALPGLCSLRVIIDPAHSHLYEDAVRGLDVPPPVNGGASRKDSVTRGLHSLPSLSDDDIILIHDAARPFVSTENILAVVAAARESGAATLTAPLADTIVTDGYDVQDRAKLHAVQTPQGFRFGIIRAAHEKFRGDDGFTDDAGHVAAMGHAVTLVPGSRMNFKITTPDDLIMAEKLMGASFETRTGMGYDVHAFDPAPATSVRLGGIDIPHDRRLAGHSDADVILHAVTDAILGAIGDGDIGQIFPPSDSQWKGADSAIFVAEALRRLHARGGTLIHADITLIAEAPKIDPHRAEMLSRLSALLGLTSDRIGLKATTSEGLGFTGRAEGIVAQAMVTIRI